MMYQELCLAFSVVCYAGSIYYLFKGTRYAQP
jgi:hypothetical protein